jgi:hypothetical protein
MLLKTIKQDCYAQKDVFENVVMQDYNERLNTVFVKTAQGM